MALRNEDLKPVRQRKYLAKDFDSLRSQILEYARQYYPDRLQDFSESSLGGLFLDMAAYVGDNMSFYLDHQYGELNPETAVEQINIQTHLKNAGVPIVGTSPAIAQVEVFIQVPATLLSGSIVEYAPKSDLLPVIQEGTIFTANNGTTFILSENIDFRKKNSDGSFTARKEVGQKRSSGAPLTFVMSMKGICVSGRETSEVFSLPSSFTPYKRITLSNPNVSEIMSVVDGFGNVYYKVDSLTNDVVYKNVLNTSSDNDLVKDAIKIIPAPYRFITEVDLQTRSTTLIMGGGSADSLEDDVIPDPTDFAIPFVYQKTFSRVSVNPKNLLQTKTLGVCATGTSLTVKYRYGGALNHNVPARSITSVSTLKIYFPDSTSSAQDISNVRVSVEVTNERPASGGEDAPTIDDLKSLIPAIKNSQDRIVSKEDLLARIYSIPSNFGRVFRAAVRPNASNPLSSELYIISRDAENKLTISSDSLKDNIVKYLTPYRLISDSIDILDAKIINLRFKFEISVDPSLNKNIIGQQVISSLKRVFNIKNFNIDQPINKSDIINTIFSIPGILSVDSISFLKPIPFPERVYSTFDFDVESNTARNSLIIPPPGGIFEIKYPDFDIEGVVR